MEFNWVLHGPQASWKPILTTTESVGGGYSIDGSINLGTVSYTGDASKITRSMVLTNSGKKTDPDVPTVWGTVAVSEELRLGVTGQVTYFKGTHQFLIGKQLNIGAGLPAGPLPINAAGGVSNTYLLYDFAHVLSHKDGD
jgi:hypothetical protein